LTHTHGGSTHTHVPPKDVTWSNLLGLGISGGLVPCPSALVLMLGAISQERIGYGIVLTLVFSFGLAATLTAVGLAFLYVGKLFDNPKMNNNPLFKALPVFSAFVITCVGVFICYSSLL
jgi:ABC-type nickel/cobalt efflux system permease component RcnA